MLKRPSSRRRSHPVEVQLNLIPMLDALVTMISFLMYTMAFLSLTMIESPLPVVSNDQNLQELREKPLQLTLTIEANRILLWSPFDLISKQGISNKPNGTIDLLKLQKALLAIKQKFPTENKIVLVPKNDTSYDTIVSVLDVTKSKQLFGEVVFGNLLGGDE